MQRSGQGAAGRGAGRAGRRAGGAGAGGGGGGNSVGGAGAGELGLAVRGGAARLGDSLAIKVTGVGSRLLGLVVGVEDVSELLGGVAHGVSAENTGGGVAVDTSARVGVLAADVSKDIAVVIGRQAGGRSARDGVEHALAQGVIGGWGQGRGGGPRSTDGRASSGRVGGRVGSHGDGAGGGGGDAGAQGRVGLELLDAGRVDNADQTCGEVLLAMNQHLCYEQGLTIVIGLLEVHVDDTASNDLGHVVRVKLGGLLESTASTAVDSVATVLSEEDRNGVVGEERDDLGVAGLLEGAVTAPLVDVVAPEVDGLGGLATVEVLGHVVADGSIVVGGVTDTQPAVEVVGDVGLGVTNGSLDEGRGVGVALVVGDLVAGEEADGVVVLGQGVDDGGVALVQGSVPLGVAADDGLVGRGQVGDDVDASVGEQRHAGVVVGGGVDGVGTDDVGAGSSQDGDISLAEGLVGERVDVVGAAGGSLGSLRGAGVLLVRNTLDVELGAVLVEEVLALCDDGLDGG